MKVIIICNLQIEDLPPVVSTITALEKNGCQVVLVTPFLSNTYKTMFNELKFYDLYKTKEFYYRIFICILNGIISFLRF